MDDVEYLSALIPAKHPYESYIPRKIGRMTDIEMVEIAVRKGHNVLLMGPTGNGKTSLYDAVCAKNEWPLGPVALNGQSTAEDIVGQLLPVPNPPLDSLAPLREAVVHAKSLLKREQFRIAKEKVEVDPGKFMPLQEAVWRTELALQGAIEDRQAGAQYVWVNGLLPRLMKGHPEFEHTAFLADEVNFAPNKILAILNPIVDYRRRFTLVQHGSEMVTAGPGFHFAAAMNPGYRGTMDLNEAFRDRFSLQLMLDYDKDVERTLIKDQKVLDFAERLRTSEENREVLTPTSTRTMLTFERLVEDFGPEIATQSLICRYDDSEREGVKNNAELILGRGTGGNTGPMRDIG